jgi:hypothetical protein
LAAIAKAGIICGVEVSMHQVANVQFERAVGEFVQWRAVPEQDRSPQQPMPAEWCCALELPNGSSFADGAEVFLKPLAGQTSLPWPDGFPGKARHPDPA